MLSRFFFGRSSATNTRSGTLATAAARAFSAHASLSLPQIKVSVLRLVASCPSTNNSSIVPFRWGAVVRCACSRATSSSSRQRRRAPRFPRSSSSSVTHSRITCWRSTGTQRMAGRTQSFAPTVRVNATHGVAATHAPVDRCSRDLGVRIWLRLDWLILLWACLITRRVACLDTFFSWTCLIARRVITYNRTRPAFAGPRRELASLRPRVL
jgi:hypothetical protein